jgi:hypothetical protein
MMGKSHRFWRDFYKRISHKGRNSDLVFRREYWDRLCLKITGMFAREGK